MNGLKEVEKNFSTHRFSHSLQHGKERDTVISCQGPFTGQEEECVPHLNAFGLPRKNLERLTVTLAATVARNIELTKDRMVLLTQLLAVVVSVLK